MADPSGIYGHPVGNNNNNTDDGDFNDPSVAQRPDPSFAPDEPAFDYSEPSLVEREPAPRRGVDPSVAQPYDYEEDDDEEETDIMESTSILQHMLHDSVAHSVQGRRDVESFSLIKTSAPSHGSASREHSSVRNAVTNQISFRPVPDGDGGFQKGSVREVTFVGDGDDGKELPAGSRLSFSAFESTLPMAFDNERFFDSENGYQDLLKTASVKLKQLGAEGGAWHEPAKEMGFVGYLWRLMVKFLVWLTSGPVNRIMYTRGLQENLPFHTIYESFVLSGVVRAFDSDDRKYDSLSMSLGIQNRNTSRVIVQFLSARWDWFWHSYTQLRWARLFDFLSLFPFMGAFSFTATENFPNTKDHAIRGLIRPLASGTWLTRLITGQQEGITTFNPDAEAQNLAAETTGFEAAGRNQVGTFFGRRETNAFRFEHRLPTDESIFRTFISSPTSTLINNGVEHVTLCLAKHYRNMLYQDNGNFAHQRMEQLNPFEFLRFHMPQMLLVFVNLRGRNAWDMRVLAPFVQKLQNLNPGKVRRGDRDIEANDAAEIHGPVRAAQALVEEMKENIVANVCGGVSSRVVPFNDLLDGIDDALTELGREAEDVRQFVSSVDTGTKLGYELLKLVDWSVPSMDTLSKAIKEFSLKKFQSDSYFGVSSVTINTALQKLAPKDERSLKELLAQGHGSMKATKLLLTRASTLLERELRRNSLDSRIRELSLGPAIHGADLEKNFWYWVKLDGVRSVVLFKGLFGDQVKFVDFDTQQEKLVPMSGLEIYQYVPVAEAIVRAQKAAMTVELDHGKRFQYNAFMEFGSTENQTSLRTRLRRLITVSQIFCYELDRARTNILNEVKHSVLKVRKSTKYATSRLVAECKPQNVTVLGGGPTGLLGGIHCIHNVLLTGGKVRILESRDAFVQEGSNFERAQIVRLDSRQTSMLRYHLGTGFEDVYIPARGETDPHMGNTLPNQGFVEVTIKRLESAILDEVINLRSKGLIDYFSDSKVEYDQVTNSFSKKGAKLKPGDIVFAPGDSDKNIEITGVKFAEELPKKDLKEGTDYDLILPREKKQRTYRLQKADQQYDFFQFVPHEAGIDEITGAFSSMPAIFKVGEGRSDPVEIIGKSKDEVVSLRFDDVKAKDFVVDFTASHVMLATGKPAASTVHFYTTTAEPYAVCCIEGIKISYGMHNFGEKRWGSGIIDDVRSHTDFNTRVIGDFTKSVVLYPVVKRMKEKVNKDAVWRTHFRELPGKLKAKYSNMDNAINEELDALVGTKFRRTRLQTRFFELGNNYYLGMEFPREFDLWKATVTSKIAPSLPSTAPDSQKKIQQQFSRAIPHQLDRLWYEACLEIIAEGDVYNPGGQSKIPPLYTIDSPFETPLGDLQELDSFRLFSKKFRFHDSQSDGFALIQGEFDQTSFAIPSKTYVLDLQSNRKRELCELEPGDRFEPIDLFEIISKGRKQSIVRTSRGYITKMDNSVRVGRSSDISRAPNGYSESKVGLASFPVAHVVCHRTLRLNRVNGKGGDDGFITAYAGDAQASPHFMRYSGLTGACINCMTLNNLVGQALTGVGVIERVQRYAFETNWSNGEVVQRGTGANYGEDGFLRPGFPYRKLIDYLYARATEHFEIGADIGALLSRDWKIKIAAAIVPRGLENDGIFYGALKDNLESVLRNKFEEEIWGALEIKAPAFSLDWDNLSLDYETLESKDGSDYVMAQTTLLVNSVAEAINQTIDYSLALRNDDKRISSELFNQPKSVDSITDDFAVEAQNFANALTQSSALTTGSVALGALSSGGDVFAALLGTWNIGVSFGSMTNVSRYRNRNEETRRLIINEKFPDILRNLFALMTPEQQGDCPAESNPFLNEDGVDGLVKKFVADCRYYNQDESKIQSFESAYEKFRISRGNNTATHAFMRQLAGEFVPESFHVSSYLQEALVNIYKALDDMLELQAQNRDSRVPEAAGIFHMLVEVRGDLKSSAELGHIYFGFIRKRPILETALFSGLKFLLGPLLWFSYAQKTARILRSVKKVEKRGNAPQSLKRAGRDLHELHHATQESRIAAMMFISAFIVFGFSVFFTFARLAEFIDSPGPSESTLPGLNEILDVAPWAALGTLIGAALAAFHFLRKLKHLLSLDWTFGKTASGGKGVLVVRLATWTQILLTIVRLGAASLAAVSLPWFIVADTFGGNVTLPAYLAAASVISAIGAAIFFFLVEFFIRYSLNTRLGETVLEPLKGRIMEIKRSFTKPGTEGIETSQRREIEAWEYTAREFFHEYRFDAVFAADRFGTLVQHIQGGGMKTKRE